MYSYSSPRKCCRARVCASVFTLLFICRVPIRVPKSAISEPVVGARLEEAVCLRGPYFMTGVVYRVFNA